jgi:hypothetical protein
VKQALVTVLRASGHSAESARIELNRVLQDVPGYAPDSRGLWSEFGFITAGPDGNPRMIITADLDNTIPGQ